jgi:hypothetical protein
MHHAYVDKIWADWQELHPRNARDYSGTDHRSRTVSPWNGLDMDRVEDLIGLRPYLIFREAQSQRNDGHW